MLLLVLMISPACQGPSAPSHASPLDGTWFLSGGSCGGKPVAVNASDSKLELAGSSVALELATDECKAVRRGSLVTTGAAMELVFEEQPECHPRDCAMLGVLACPKTPLERRTLPLNLRGEVLVLTVANGCESNYQRKNAKDR
jgi:hypothetical protein